MNRRDRIEKLRRMAESNSPFEAAIARETLNRLLDKPDPVESNTVLRFVGPVEVQLVEPGAVNSGQLPGVIRIPTAIGARR